MSQALNLQDASSQSHDLSLGSLASGFSTPGRFPGSARVPSISSGTTASSSQPISTPSPPNGPPVFRRKSTGLGSALRREDDDDQDDEDADEDKGGGRWNGDIGTPRANKTKARPGASGGGGKGGVTLTLRDQEKHIDNLRKENFDIKLRVHFLEDRLAQLAPDQMEAALKQNINLKIEVHSRGREIKRLKKLLLELEKELERLQRGGTGGNRGKERERELEEKLAEREFELREMRRRKSGPGSEHLEARNAELEEQLENATALLHDNNDEIERLREMLERRRDDSNISEGGGNRLKRKVTDLEEENEELRAKLEEQTEIAAQRDDDAGELADEVERLKLDVEELQRRREADSMERTASRAHMLEEREEREAVEEDLNSLKDRLTAAQIELQQKDDELDMRNQEIENLVAEHERIVTVVEEEWRGEVNETRNQVEELRDALTERDTESKELRLNVAELEAYTNDVHEKFEAALGRLEQEAEEKDGEINSLNAAIEKLGEQVYVLEDENDRVKEEAERLREDEAAERERLEALTTALKDKLAGLKAELEEMTEAYEICSRDIHAHRSRQEELAQHVEELVHEVKRERQAREQLETDFDAQEKDHEEAIRKEKRAYEAKESALQSALNDLSRTQSLLSQRDADLQAVQSALQSLETESKRAGETHSTARFSLQLEFDRLKRDLERVEDELARARKELEDRENKGRDRDGVLDRLHADNRDLASQLASQTQARLNMSEKLDSVQESLRKAETDTNTYRSRVAELESRLSKDQRSLLSAENQYKDQLTERNTLLLTIYRYMDKILGVDKTPQTHGQGETKPFTNFSVFHDNLITRLKSLSQIQMDFDKRCKEVEGRYSDKLSDMRKQLDTRWKQIDRFEASVKTYADTKASWKRKFTAKEGELDAIRATNTEMAAQLSGMKRTGQSDPMELRSLSTRAVNAERRLNNAQNQLAATEEKIGAMNKKMVAADSKWEARVKEYETRLKAAEEKVKRERQGGKERALELENNMKTLQRQLELAQKRNQQLNEVVETSKTPASPAARP